MVRILGIGINTMDVYRQKGKMYPGGNEYNIAIHAARQGGEAGFIGVFSQDEAGELLKRPLKESGVDISHSSDAIGSSGYAIVDLVEGDRVFVDWNRHGVTDEHPFAITEEKLAYAKSFDIVSVSRNSRMSNVQIGEMGKTGVPMSMDFCDDFTIEEVEALAPYLEFSFFSASHLKEEEVKELLERVYRAGCPISVATLGSKGSMAYDGMRYYCQECISVEAIDTMGAGDSFISAFLYTYLRIRKSENQDKKNAISEALRAAAEYAAKIVTLHGSLGIEYDIDTELFQKLFHKN